MTNFDVFAQEQVFASFAEFGVYAERAYQIAPTTCVTECRKALELAVKWMYEVDNALEKPFQDSLASLIHTHEFRSILNDTLLRQIEYIWRTGNFATHSGKKVAKEQAALCLENLYYFFDFLATCYADDYSPGSFDRSLLERKQEYAQSQERLRKTELQLEAALKENDALRQELEARRAELSKRGAERRETYTPNPLNVSEYETRKLYIDELLRDVDWVENKNWINEYEITGMPNKSEKGYADYALLGDDGRVLAIIEAKKTCKDPAQGREQAKLYADLIEKKQGRRPVVFLSNGFETRIVDNVYPERKVAAFYSKRDLEEFFYLRQTRQSLANATVDDKIAGRYYQKAAIRAVCDSFEKKRRRALLVMATGSGKTRTVIGLIKTLQKSGWVKNFLFLADRDALVSQGCGSFKNSMPDLYVTNLCDDKENCQARGVFSTYPTMMNSIDAARDEKGGKLFSSGHFDLVICDEAHRSIYNKYKDIFNYFDAPLVGLTATPKSEIDKNTYEFFELEKGIPTYGYDLKQAVEDGYLVSYTSVEIKQKFLREGIVYADLSDEEKQEYEETFADEDGNIPDSIESSALNSWIFNENTIRESLNIFMEKGLKVQSGSRIGKTIIFAKNHAHAERIYKVFGKEFPELIDSVKVIDNRMGPVEAQNAINEFKKPEKSSQIAISVDMLDTGIDVPDVLNLVILKAVKSKAKFWQMIGRGTRLCPKLIDGDDKSQFYVFDFCGNFEFFSINSEGKPVPITPTLQGSLFCLQLEMAWKLQDINYQTENLIAFRKTLVEKMVKKVRGLNQENFAIRQHLKYVNKYSTPENYQVLTYSDLLDVKEELAPLLPPDDDEHTALRFDALMYGIELACLEGKQYGRKDLLKKVGALTSVANIPEVNKQKDLIEAILHTNYLEVAGVDEFEHIRKNLRDLMKYLTVEKRKYDTNFTDEILEIVENEADLESGELQNYREKVEHYLHQHQNSGAISKLRMNIPLTDADVKELETILWGELGEKKDYEETYGAKPLGELVRGIVGLDMNAAKEAFSKFLNDVNLDSRQIYFVNQIVEFIAHNGVMKDLRVVQETPFTDRGSLGDVFKDASIWYGVRKVIDEINANAAT